MYSWSRLHRVCGLGVVALAVAGIMAGYVGHSVADESCPNEEVDPAVWCDVGGPFLSEAFAPCVEFNGRESRCNTALYVVRREADREARRFRKDCMVVEAVTQLPPRIPGPPAPTKILCARVKVCKYVEDTGVCEIGPEEDIMQQDYNTEGCYLVASGPYDRDPDTTR